MVSKILKNVAVVSVLFSSFMFVGCGESESDLKNIALEKCKERANNSLKANQHIYEKITNTEILRIEEHNKCFDKCDDFKQAVCKVTFIAKQDFDNVKKGSETEIEYLITLEKKSGKWS